MITKQVESAQKRIEGNNYDTRRNVLQYDDVMREQREVIYSQRQQVIMEEESLEYVIMPMIKRTIERIVQVNTQGPTEEWNLQTILDFAHAAILHPDDLELTDLENKTTEEIVNVLFDHAKKNYKEKREELNGPEQMLEFEKVILLRVVDGKWTDHIDQMDQLRQGIGLRSYGQENPLIEYQQEGFKLFEEMIAAIDHDVTRLLMKSQIRQNLQRQEVGGGATPRANRKNKGPVRFNRQNTNMGG